MRKFGKLFVIITAAMAIVSVCSAATVSWNYNRYSDAYGSGAQGTDFAGVVSVSYWNDSWLDARTTDLLDNMGAATTIDISWTSYNSWSIQSTHPGIDTDGSHNKEILNGYLNSGPAPWNPPLTYSAVTLSQIEYSSYDIIVYFSSDVAGREGYVTDGSITYYFNTLGPASIASGNALLTQATNTTEGGYATSANYAVFSGLSGAGQTITVQMRDNDEWGGVAAVQIVEVTSISYNSPMNGATLIPVQRTAEENDLIFTVIDPNINQVDVQFGTEDDPNLTTIAAYKIVDGMAVTTGQYTIDLESELAADLQFETIYYWKVIGYTDSNSVDSPVWSFTTAPEAPLITSGVTPAYTAVDAGEPNIVLSVTGINGDFQWYKDGSQINDLVGVYAGAATKTLTIYDVQSADEGYYTCKISSLVGEDESTPGRVMIHRLTSHYTFDEITVVDSNSVFEDSIDGYHAVLMQESASAGLPSVNDVNEIVGTGCLQLDNADNASDPNGQYLQIYPGVVDYEDITISFWAQPTAVAVWARLFDFGNGAPDYLFITPDFGTGYDPRFAMRIDSGTEQQLQPDLDSSNWIGPGTGWHFVAVTLSGDTGKMFVDGLWYATNTSMTVDPIDVGAVVNYIGKSQFVADPEFSGYIDDLKIYNYARTNEQIAQDYMAVTDDSYICDTENNDVWRYDQGWQSGDEWIGGNNNCMIDLPDFVGMAARWLEADQFFPAP